MDVYLFPAVVGGGLGDVEEVLAAGRRLAGAGYSVRLYRAGGRPLPHGVEGPWDWPAHARSPRLIPRSRAALTIAPAWGVSAAPARDEPLGRPGPWAAEARAVERRYGPRRTVHVSLEEFARTLTSTEETRERFREGGVRARRLSRLGASPTHEAERAAFAEAFRRFRGFDRPNVLHLFATFERRPSFSREFPASVQVGPLGSGVRWSRGTRSVRPRTWVWYASPASAERIAPGVVRELGRQRPPIRLLVRTPRPWRSASWPAWVTVRTEPMSPASWRRQFASAELRIVTGSRSLLEALELGGPFLYFNGVMGSGTARRRHRPEKLVGLLSLARHRRWPPGVLRDLADFGRGRRVSSVVARAAARREGWARDLPRLRARGFRRPFDDAARVVLEVARALARPDSDAARIVARFRRRANP